MGMAVAERTYSFRAADTLGDRMRQAATLLGTLQAQGENVDDLAGRVARSWRCR